MAPTPDLSAVIVELPVATAGLQALIVPSNVSKINTAGPDLPFAETVKSVGFGLMFPTTPVGMPRLPAGVEGAGGTVTTSGTCAPAAVYSVEKPVPLSLTQYGEVGSETRPHPLTRC